MRSFIDTVAVERRKETRGSVRHIEDAIARIQAWTFGTYAFIAVALFLLCALLFPDSLRDDESYEDYFHARRAWFFGLLGTTFLLDIVDTVIKGEAHFEKFAFEYLVRTSILLALCAAGSVTASRHFHRFFVAAMLADQMSWILRLLPARLSSFPVECRETSRSRAR